MTASRNRRGGRAVLKLVGLGCGVLVLLSLAVVLPWRWVDPPTSAFIVRASTAEAPIELRWVDWSEISPALPIAVVAAEDQHFPTHWGFDVESIRSAFEEDRQRTRGASTISQQVVKNLFLWGGRSWIRKGLEAYLTLLVESLWPKERILEIYLNIAEFGPQIFGVGQAAPIFFGKQPAALTGREAALLAAVLPAPQRMSPAKPSPYVEERVGWIQRQVAQLGGPSYLADL